MTRAKHRPPSFTHYHPDKAKKLKKAWVEKAKIKSKWKYEKRKAGHRPPPPVTAIGDSGEEDSDLKPDLEPMAEQPPAPPSESTQHRNTSPTDRSSLRDLAKTAYSPTSLHIYTSRHRGPSNCVGRKGQPNMKLRVNALLAKIKRDHPH